MILIGLTAVRILIVQQNFLLNFDLYLTFGRVRSLLKVSKSNNTV